MTKDQIENYRKLLLLEVGSYALLMPDEEIIAHRDKMQERINKMSEDLDEKPCTYKPFSDLKHKLGKTLDK